MLLLFGIRKMGPMQWYFKTLGFKRWNHNCTCFVKSRKTSYVTTVVRALGALPYRNGALNRL